MKRFVIGLLLLSAAACVPRDRALAPGPSGDSTGRGQEAALPATPPGMLACTTREVSSDVPGWPNTLVLTDVDRDGALDAAVTYGAAGGRSNHSRLTVQRGDGGGQFREIEDLKLGKLSYALGAADLDGDGIDELFTNDYFRRRLLLFSPTSGGKLRGPIEVPGRFQPSGIDPHDTDGDGDLDLLVSSLRYVQIFENRGRLAFRAAGAAAVRQAPDRIAPVDRDGKRELMVVANDTARLYTLEARPGNRLEVTGSAATCRSPSTTRAADLDGDGAAELVYHCDHAFAVRPGRGGEPVRVASPGIEALGLGDLDADGDIDAITAGRPCSTCGSQVRLFANDGRGRFEERSTMEVDGTAGSPAVTDVDGDGAPDLVMTVWPGTPPGRIAVYLGGACGTLPR